MEEEKMKSNSKPITEIVLIKHLRAMETRMEARFDAKLEFYRSDTKDHLQSAIKGLRHEMEGMNHWMKKEVHSIKLELIVTQNAIKEVKTESIQHGKDIRGLQEDMKGVKIALGVV